MSTQTSTTITATADCGCPGAGHGGHSCGALPAGFSRLRYFFGKRMQVADFVDEQRYHAGKLRMHNQLLHGSGVVCGLGASVFEPDWPGANGADGEDSTVLRIGKGVALDRCGREIVVGWDQCIDVDAWYRRARDAAHDESPDAEPDTLWPADVLEGDRLALCVVLRYRECPASPEPAPRDPCACDDTGADYGRVREGFTLELVARDELPGGADAEPAGWPAGLHPARAALDGVLAAGGPGAENLARALAGAIAAGCPEPVEAVDQGLLLACFQAVVSADRERVERIEELAPAAPTLHSTALLQELLVRQLAAGAEADALVAGPAIESIELAIDESGEAYTLTLRLTGPVVAGTVPESAFALRRLDPAAGWEAPGGDVTSTYKDDPAPALVITVANADAFLADGRSYRLSLAVDPLTPIVDEAMRPLRPLRFSYHFALSGPAEALELVSVPRTDPTA